MVFSYNSSGEVVVRSQVAIPINTWNLLTFTLNASNPSNALAFYVNGVQQTLTSTAFAPLSTAGTNDLRVGTAAVNNQPLVGNLDDFGMFDTALTKGKARAIYTAPSLLSGYNLGVVDSLFDAFDSAGSVNVGSLDWQTVTGFDVTGHSLGDTWLAGDGSYRMWLSGASGSAAGLIAVPEPATVALFALGAGFILFSRKGRKA